MLRELIAAGFGYQKNDYAHSLNCAEKILNGANIIYNLEMDSATLHMASGFAAGAFMGGTCGALCAAIMVIGRLETGFSQHQTPSLRHKLEKMLGDYQADTDSLLCRDLRPIYGEQQNCMPLLLKTAGMLDKFYLSFLEEENNV